jgi:DNA-binding MarR family transcriptional regulator
VDARSFRDRVRALVRALGVLDDARTPCGVDVSVREAFALGALLHASEDDAPSQSDLQRMLGIDKSNVTRLVQRMIDEVWLEQRAGQDARVRTLHLTVKGRKLALRLEETSVQRFRIVLGHLPREERSGVLRSLELLEGALRRVAQTEGP